MSFSLQAEIMKKTLNTQKQHKDGKRYVYEIMKKNMNTHAQQLP